MTSCPACFRPAPTQLSPPGEVRETLVRMIEWGINTLSISRTESADLNRETERSSKPESVKPAAVNPEIYWNQRPQLKCGRLLPLSGTPTKTFHHGGLQNPSITTALSARRHLSNQHTKQIEEQHAHLSICRQENNSLKLEIKQVKKY